jgi:hypothetical protein
VDDKSKEEGALDPSASYLSSVPISSTSTAPGAPESEEDAIFAELEKVKQARINEHLVKEFFARALFYTSLDEQVRSSSVFVFDTPRDSTGHYLVNTTYTRQITFPGAERISVEFDPQCHTEYESDSLTLYTPVVAPSCIARFEMSNKSIPAVFSGVFSDSPSDGTGDAPGSTGWPKISIDTDRVVAQFVADGFKSFWGVRFTASAEFPILQRVDPARVQEVLARDSIIEVLKRVALSKEDMPPELTELELKVRKYSGMALANLIMDAKRRQKILSRQPSTWVLQLLDHGPEDAQLRLIGALLGSGTGRALEGSVKDLIAKSEGLLETFVSKLTSTSPEIAALALQVLRGCLNIEEEEVEAVLIKALGHKNLAVQKQALKRICQIASESGEGEGAGQTKGVSL